MVEAELLLSAITIKIIKSLVTSGKDDLRQDAVMQQVFELTNQLFTESKDTQEHRIVISIKT